MSKRYRLLTVREGREAGLSEDISEKDATKLRRGLLLSATVDYSEDPEYPEITATDGWSTYGMRDGGGAFSEEVLEFDYEFSESTRPAQFVLEVTSDSGAGGRFMHFGENHVALRFDSNSSFLYISSVKLWAADTSVPPTFWTNFRKCKELPS